MIKHTELPWRVGDAGLTIFGPPNGNPSPVSVAHIIKTPDYRANAAFIIRACNAHADLIAALQQAIESSGFLICGPTDSRVAEHGEPAWICNARAALAKAQS